MNAIYNNANRVTQKSTPTRPPTGYGATQGTLRGSEKIAAINKEVDELKEVMLDNVGKVMERGENIEVLKDKTDALREEAKIFENVSSRLHKNMRNRRCTLIIVTICIAALILLALLIYFSVRTKNQ